MPENVLINSLLILEINIKTQTIEYNYSFDKGTKV